MRNAIAITLLVFIGFVLGYASHPKPLFASYDEAARWCDFE